ncbi:hypothetical protein, partial [Streptomyces acidiscabies]|uniref:hypothetical protein n=1 Tax=Streptomyces acidiscabies TaxID=42234 RepID=UPI0029A87C00|nr:hypothetical protein [Streptomyces acidiscabies]
PPDRVPLREVHPAAHPRQPTGPRTPRRLAPRQARRAARHRQRPHLTAYRSGKYTQPLTLASPPDLVPHAASPPAKHAAPLGIANAPHLTAYRSGKYTQPLTLASPPDLVPHAASPPAKRAAPLAVTTLPPLTTDATSPHPTERTAPLGIANTPA